MCGIDSHGNLKPHKGNDLECIRFIGPLRVIPLTDDVMQALVWLAGVFKRREVS